MTRSHLGLSMLTLLPALLAACGGTAHAPAETLVAPTTPNGTAAPPVTVGDRPAGVPASAVQVIESQTLGRFVRSANQPPAGEDVRELRSASCQDGIVQLATSEETIYLSLGCDRFLPPDTVEAFVGNDIAIVFDVTEGRLQVFLETRDNAQVQFTPDGIWVE